MTPLSLIFIRHGESAGNVDKRKHLELADHAIPLTDTGRRQAYAAGQWLGRHFLERNTAQTRTRFWVSPYTRTRQTADEVIRGVEAVAATASDHDRAKFAFDRREHVNLVEQQFGLFDGIPEDQLPLQFPRESAHFDKQVEFEGRFWARMPLGESRFDVAIRVHQAFGTFQRDYDKNGIDQIVVVSHGVTIRAFLMQWLHHPYEWFEQEKNPPNASIRLVHGRTDLGYVFAPTDTQAHADRNAVPEPEPAI
ncbi:histidine phosphatase family protein [Lysobacter antibioticus]|uniref:histidine phosphatase family protein n=1 Tax=Lysobacter antibioticus TaxID=84531 RepID=UPI00034B1A08|nr:histidine phosphatase family protein [Lysobacter antibioticus]